MFTADFAERPHWWDLAAPEAGELGDLPATADVAIVGSGYTSLVRRLHLARAGRSVLVLEAELAGHGASRRNAGYLGRTLKRSFTWWNSITGRSSRPASIASWMRRGNGSMRWSRTSASNATSRSPAAFIGATSEAHYNDLAQELEAMRRRLGFPYEMIAPMDLRASWRATPIWAARSSPISARSIPRSITRAAQGRARRGCPRLHPDTRHRPGARRQGRDRRHHARPRQRARSDRRHQRLHAAPCLLAGAARHPVRRLHGRDRGTVAGADGKLIPNGRTVIDSNVNINFIRPAPDSAKILFGGLTGSKPRDLRDMGSACTRW
jgi:glycine/D-amino acid oxidase-like deaminating enzyme